MAKPPSDSKKPSGQDNRKAKEAREEQERREEIERRSLGDDEMPEHVKQFLVAGPPPLGNPVAGVLWANDVAMMMMQAVLRDPLFTFEKKLRYVSDLTGKMGLLHSKAHMQKRLADLVKDEEDPEGDDGLSPHPLAGTDT